MPLPKPCISSASTTVPASPTSSREFPTSVTTHGTPTDIASPTTFGNPSATDAEANTSKAGRSDAISLRSPRSSHFSAIPAFSSHRLNSHVLIIKVLAYEQSTEVRYLGSHCGKRFNQTTVVLCRGPATY